MMGFMFSPEEKREGLLRPSRPVFLRYSPTPFPLPEPLRREPPAYRKAFCSVCGSPLPLVRQDSDFVVLLAGVLDGTPETAPFRHVFLSQKAPWYGVDDDLIKFDERPPPDQRLPQRDQG